VSEGVREIRTPHGTVACPAFLPDSTRAVVRAVDSADLEACGVPGVVMSTFHLMQTPGSSTIAALGGLHAMTAWQRTIVTDSGGFQAYSVIQEQPKLGGMSDDGLHIRPEGSERKFVLTPEKSVRLQINYGADVALCLDQCTHADAPDPEQDRAVARTIEWARRGKEEAERLLDQKRVLADRRPRLWGVVQGGRSIDRRRHCAEALLGLGLDGFGFGGWPLDREGNLLLDLIAATREMIPRAFPFHALGVGHPESVVACVRAGCDIFDSALPTRDARRGRLYRFSGAAPRTPNDLEPGWFAFLYIQDKKHVKDARPVIPGCPCPVCTRYSIGYLHHLFELEDSAYPRLATLHNLYFMERLMALLRGETAVWG
jgi:queuine tRNA-ribosyltransferase